MHWICGASSVYSPAIAEPPQVRAGSNLHSCSACVQSTAEPAEDVAYARSTRPVADTRTRTTYLRTQGSTLSGGHAVMTGILLFSGGTQGQSSHVRGFGTGRGSSAAVQAARHTSAPRHALAVRAINDPSGVRRTPGISCERSVCSTLVSFIPLFGDTLLLTTPSVSPS
jgi:hypothetical protein